MVTATSDAACSRCGRPSLHRTRGEDFCSECFVDFVNNKFRKSMDKFRVNYLVPDIPTIVVGVSFGPSSLALVALLESLLKHQRAKQGGRVGFTIECVYIGQDVALWPFESHLKTINESMVFGKLLEIENHEYSMESPSPLSRSSRQDLQSQLTRRALDEIFLHSRAAKLVLGYNMTRLSELVIAETVKGRGAGLKEAIDPSADSLFPLREILISEIHTYLEIMGLAQHAKPDPVAPAVTKLQSIDEIVRNYFSGLQTQFPQIVSTVAKTASKLSQKPEECSICQNGTGLCYGCRVMLTGTAGPLQVTRHSLQDVLEEFELSEDP